MLLLLVLKRIALKKKRNFALLQGPFLLINTILMNLDIQRKLLKL